MMVLRVQQFPSLYAVLEERQRVCLLKVLFEMFVAFKTSCFQNVAFQVCFCMCFALLCFVLMRAKVLKYILSVSGVGKLW